MLPIEEDTIEIGMFGNDFLDKRRDFVQFRNIKHFCRDLALVFTCKLVKVFLSAANGNDMSSSFGISLCEREPNSLKSAMQSRRGVPDVAPRRRTFLYGADIFLVC
jgi:hypothetical protein